jgi:nitroreductase
MGLNLSADEVLLTTRSVRKRLDFDRPVERELIDECLEISLQAPTGSNMQGWHFVMIDEQKKKDAIAKIYHDAFMLYYSLPKPEYAEGDVRRESMPKVGDSALFLAKNMQRAPYLMIPVIQGRAENAGGAMAASLYGSILPAAWSFMLALRERGLGSAWTTLHLLGEGEREAADILGIPFETHSQVGLFPVAYTVGTDFKPAKRLPLSQVSHWNTW